MGTAAALKSEAVVHRASVSGPVKTRLCGYCCTLILRANLDTCTDDRDDMHIRLVVGQKGDSRREYDDSADAMSDAISPDAISRRIYIVHP